MISHTLIKSNKYFFLLFDKYNPVLPKSMLRGYGGVAIIWRENIDHLIKILPDGAERIQCVEINSNNDTKLFGKTGLYLSTPFPTKLMFLFKSPIVLI
jgi:hypothetical protein